jgi:hypothetical protein
LHDWRFGGCAGHPTIGDNVRIQAQTGVEENIKDNEVLQGSPAFAYNDYSKSYVHFKKPKNCHWNRRIKETTLNQKNGNNGYRKTINRSLLNGVGLHTGKEVKMTLNLSQ